MPWMRLSTYRPLPGHRTEVERIVERLGEMVSKKEGFVMTLHFVGSDESGDMGRLTIWESAEAANRAAADEDIQALRSQLHIAILSGHMDYLAEIKGTPIGTFSGQ